MKALWSKLRGLVTPVDATTPKMNNFNMIRFFAAFMVVYGHMSSIMGEPAFPLFTQRVSTIGVKIFFTISGYLITKSYLSDRHLGRYLIRRSFRIFPALIVLILLSVFALGPIMTELTVGEYFANEGTLGYLKNILLCPVYALPGVFTDSLYPNVVNGSLWTLPVEFAMYLILVLCVTVFEKLGSVKWGVAISAVLTLAASLIFLGAFQGSRLVCWGTNLFDALPLLPYFFIGSLLSFPEMKKLFNFQLSVALLILAGFINFHVVWNELAVAIALPYFIICFALVERPAFSAWFTKSDLSYGLYLFAFPIQQIVYKYTAGWGWNAFCMAVLCFAITTVPAILSWNFVEKPVMGLGQKWIAHSKAKASAH